MSLLTELRVQWVTDLQRCRTYGAGFLGLDHFYRAATGPFCRATSPTAVRTTSSLIEEWSPCVRLGGKLPPRTAKLAVPSRPITSLRLSKHALRQTPRAEETLSVGCVDAKANVTGRTGANLFEKRPSDEVVRRFDRVRLIRLPANHDFESAGL